MKPRCNQLSFLLSTLLIATIVGSARSEAQTITPANDGIRTQVNSNGTSLDISGGQLSQDGANLFHSFSQFGLTPEQTANFLSQPSIQNILGRVNGGSPSFINGLIRVTGGNSNLFLLNPSGIVFGSNARLDVPASFTATTANGIGFGSGWFNASGVSDYANLVGNPNSFAFATSQPGSIINAGNLEVKTGQNLSLLGGTVVSTGELSAPGGNITVAAVPGENLVRLSQVGNVLSLDVRPLDSDRPNNSSLPVASLPQLLTGGNIETASGIIVNSNGQVELTAANLPVSNGDLVVKKALSGQITLSAANNLTLVESNLQSTGDLNLFAGNTVRARDSASNPFIAEVGQRLYLQGNQNIDLFALNHPASGLFAGGDLVLRSANTVGGDAHYWTGGNFRIEKLDGSAGNLFSPYDPVILANGDVSLGDYTGASLHILAGGRVNLGNVTITSPDTTGGAIDPTNVNPLLSRFVNLTLSDGTSLTINGTTVPTLDVRAGVNWSALGSFPNNTILGTLSSSPTFGNTATNSSITVGDISITAPNGQVFLTNQFFPNNALPAGAINTGIINLAGTNGSVIIDSKIAANTSIFPATITGNATVRSTGDSFSLSFTIPSLTSNNRIRLTGFISRSTSNSNIFNIAYVMDLSGSTSSQFNGEVTVGDENGDGTSNTILDGEIAGFVSLNQSLIDLGIAGNTRVGLIGFATNAAIADVQPAAGIQISTAPNADLNANGIFDIVEVLRSTREGEIGRFSPQNVGLGTNFTGALDSTINFFETLGATGANNRVFFLSDGQPNNNDFTDSSSILRDPNGISAQITAVGLGSGASAESLDLLDDGTANNSAPISLDPSSLRANLQQSGIEPANIERVEILLNGIVIQTITPDRLVPSPLGLQFETSIPGLQIGAEGIEVRVVLSDEDATTVTAQKDVQVIANNRSFQSAPGAFPQGDAKIIVGSTLPPVNQPPLAIADTVIASVNLPVNIDLIDNDSDPNGDVLKAIAISQPRNGIAVLNPDGTVTYTPNNGFTGTDSFTYTISDGKGGTATGTATVTVPPNLDQEAVVESSSGVVTPNNSLLVARSQDFRVDTVVGNIEAALTREFDGYFKKSLETSLINLTDARSTLSQIEKETGIKPALLYAVFTPQSGAKSNLEDKQTAQDSDILDLVIVTAKDNPIRVTVPEATRAKIREAAIAFRTQVSDPKLADKDGYLAPAQQLYQWIIKPIEPDLQRLGIQNLMFISDSGLRSLPLGALHDGKQFVVEKYSIGLAPSLSLTDTRFASVKDARVLAMGAEQFRPDQDQVPLVAAPVEVETVAEKVWRGKPILNRDFTLSNLKGQRERQPFSIVHLATHADFQPGDPANSYIQLYDTKVPLDQARNLGFANPGTELLVVSACRSALGDRESELGFAGFAVQAGVKSVIASLWDVSDSGALSLMSEFYRQLDKAPIKAEALRQAQIAMIKGQVKIEGNDLIVTGTKIPLSPEVADYLRRNTVGQLSHPFYWAPFTIVGSPW